MWQKKRSQNIFSYHLFYAKIEKFNHISIDKREKKQKKTKLSKNHLN